MQPVASASDAKVTLRPCRDCSWRRPRGRRHCPVLPRLVAMATSRAMTIGVEVEISSYANLAVVACREQLVHELEKVPRDARGASAIRLGRHVFNLDRRVSHNLSLPVFVDLPTVNEAGTETIGLNGEVRTHGIASIDAALHLPGRPPRGRRSRRHVVAGLRRRRGCRLDRAWLHAFSNLGASLHRGAIIRASRIRVRDPRALLCRRCNALQT